MGEYKEITLERVIELKLKRGALVGKTEEEKIKKKEVTEKSFLGIRL